MDGSACFLKQPLPPAKNRVFSCTYVSDFFHDFPHFFGSCKPGNSHFQKTCFGKNSPDLRKLGELLPFLSEIILNIIIIKAACFKTEQYVKSGFRGSVIYDYLFQIVRVCLIFKNNVSPQNTPYYRIFSTVY